MSDSDDDLPPDLIDQQADATSLDNDAPAKKVPITIITGTTLTLPAFVSSVYFGAMRPPISASAHDRHAAENNSIMLDAVHCTSRLRTYIARII